MEELFEGTRLEDLTPEQLARYKAVNAIKYWFNIEYTKLEQKYRRLKALNMLCDDGSNPEIKLLELYNLAEQKRLEIQRLGG